ncbi:hypothetical protein ABBQ38_001846 [Trebouxia sp. C0009 RCD-2024]
MATLDDALRQPDLPPGPHYLQNSQITCGVLHKYVNFGKGWRHRVFVLKDGVFLYYKIFGVTAINVPDLLQSLRKEGDVATIGTETGVLESKRTVTHSFKNSFDKGERPTPQGEVNLQGCTVHASEEDSRKFYVNNNGKQMKLRAESEDDRQAWLSALQKAKAGSPSSFGTGAGVHVTASPKSMSSAARADPQFRDTMVIVRQQLVAKGAGPEIQAYVEQLMLERHETYKMYATAEADKRRHLLDHVSRLENEKRQLETNLVVEQRIQNRGSDKDSTASQSDDERDEDDSGSVVSNGTEDIFFECNTDLGRVSNQPILGGASTSGAAQEYSHPQGFAQGATPAMTYPQQAPGPEVSNPQASSQYQQPSASQYPGQSGAGMAAGAMAGAAAAAGAVAGGDSTSGQVADMQPQGSGQINKDWVREMQPPPPRRDSLPTPKQQEKSVSLWSILKECIGKDLSRICLPVYFNEPLSVLQKTVEDLEYADLVNKAATFPPQSIERMLHVAAFAVSSYSGTNNRTLKPFNPLLGETFEFQYPEEGWRGIAEKVVHHPTVIAAHGEGEHWSFAGDAEVRSKFWGRSIELTPVGLIRLKFDDGDEYTWAKVTSSINNLIMGKIYIEHTGLMKINNLQSSMVAKIRFKEAGRLSSKDAHQVVGTFEKDGQKLPHTLTGKWDTALEAQMADGTKETIWRVHPLPKITSRYNMTKFATWLNELTPPGLEKKLAPTDCRLRPDQHFLEEGVYDQANVEKQRLEVKQRAARKAAEQGDPIEPRWFHRIQDSVPGETPVYTYKGGYWEARKTGNWEGCRDIFGPAM